jgi:hypothetical protein
MKSVGRSERSEARHLQVRFLDMSDFVSVSHGETHTQADLPNKIEE